MDKLNRTLKVILCWIIAIAPLKGSADPAEDYLKELAEISKKVHGQYPDSVKLTTEQINGVTVYHVSVTNCYSNNICKEVLNKTYRESTGFKQVDGQFIHARTIDGFNDDRILAGDPTRAQQAPKPRDIKRIDYVAGYSTSASSSGPNVGLQMRVSPPPDLKKELQQILPSVVDAVTNSAKDLDRAIKTSQVLHEAYQNNLKALEKFTALLENRREIIAKNGSINESVSSTALSMMSAQVDTSSISTEALEELRRFESVKQDPLAFRQYEFTALAEHDLLKATDNAINERNIRALAKNAEAGNGQIDKNKRKAFADRYKNFLKNGLVQVGTLNPRSGPAPLDNRRFEVPEDTPAGQALRRTGNLAQVLWSEQGGFEYATDQSKAAYIAGLVSLSSAEGSFVDGDYNQGFSHLVASSKFLQASVGFTKGLYTAGKDAVMAYPMMAQAAASLAQALVEDPYAVAERAADFILKTPEIADAIGKAALAYGRKFAEGGIETRGEIIGRISGEVLAIYITAGATKLITSSVVGSGRIMQVESQASRFTKIAGPTTAIRQSLEGRVVVMQPKVIEAINAIQKIMPPGQDYWIKYERIAAEFGKLEMLSINSLPEAIEHRKLVIQIRDGYNLEVSKIGEIAQASLNAGKSLEEVARECNSLRRSIGEKYKDMTPETLRKDIYGWNKNRYGDELGPSFSDFVNKGLKDGDSLTDIYVNIIQKSQRPNKHLNNLIEILKELP